LQRAHLYLEDEDDEDAEDGEDEDDEHRDTEEDRMTVKKHFNEK
jgi:hypothetical protein